jgi:hypothetical protein
MFQQLINTFQNASAERSTTPELISFLTLRRAVGILGLALPFALVLGSMAVDQCGIIQPSISHYYYTNMREIFVGVLCAVSLFLFSYKGHSKLDSWSSNLAGFFCLGVALFPTGKANFPCQHDVVSFITWEHQNWIHLGCAACFFITLAFISIFLFTKSDQPKASYGIQKKKRNHVYVGCGLAMIASLLIILIYFLADGDESSQVVFTFETTALLAFGTSWLTKGKTLFKD